MRLLEQLQGKKLKLNITMSRKILIRDLTLRDGQQSAFATRMTQGQIDTVLPFYKDANFYAMEVWGGAVPDSVMRFLGENPWDRLEKTKSIIGDVSKLTALSRGRNLFGYAPYPDNIIDGFCKTAIESGLGIMRIFDALNDVDNVKATIKYVKKYGGIADCAVCYTIDPNFTFAEKVKAFLKGKPVPSSVFTDDYFVNKAKQMAALGADMITIKDMSGLIPPTRVATLIRKIKAVVNIPIDFHTHCTPGVGLASVVSAINSGVDILDTVIWNFAGGPAAPPIELIYLFCKKMDVELDVNMEAVAKINTQLLVIRKELEAYDAVKKIPIAFNPVTDNVPTEVSNLIDKAIKAVKSGDEATLISACQAIEKYFGFPAPNQLVKDAEIPGGMYTNMVAQLKQLKAEDILESAMKLIPKVRLDAGLPPLVTPTSQIVGAQAVSCAMDIRNGKPMYSNTSTQFVALVKGEYGATPVKVDPEFRLKIAGVREETNYDVSKYKMQPNPELPECNNVLLAENNKEVLLLELFPLVAKDYLTKYKKTLNVAPKVAVVAEEVKAVVKESVIPTLKIVSPLPGRILSCEVKVGDMISVGQTVVILEAMKMENSIMSDFAGKVHRIVVNEGDIVMENNILIEVLA